MNPKIAFRSDTRFQSETVEKVPKQILGEDAEKNDFTERATINDLTIMEGREETPQKTPINHITPGKDKGYQGWKKLEISPIRTISIFGGRRKGGSLMFLTQSNQPPR